MESSDALRLLQSIDSKLAQIVAQLDRQPIFRPSSYSQCLDARGKEYHPNRKTGGIKCERKDKGHTEDPFSDRP